MARAQAFPAYAGQEPVEVTLTAVALAGWPVRPEVASSGLGLTSEARMGNVFRPAWTADEQPAASFPSICPAIVRTLA